MEHLWFKSPMDDKSISEAALMTGKEARELLYALLRDRWVDIQVGGGGVCDRSLSRGQVIVDIDTHSFHSWRRGCTPTPISPTVHIPIHHTHLHFYHVITTHLISTVSPVL